MDAGSLLKDLWTGCKQSWKVLKETRYLAHNAAISGIARQTRQVTIMRAPSTRSYFANKHLLQDKGVLKGFFRKGTQGLTSRCQLKWSDRRIHRPSLN